MKFSAFVIVLALIAAPIFALALAYSSDSASVGSSTASDIAPSDTVSTGTAPTKSVESPAVPPSIGPAGGVSGGSTNGCGAIDSVACAKLPAPTPIISCSSVASDTAVSKCIKSTIQSGSLGTPAIDKATKQKRPTSTTSCVLNPNQLSVPVNTKSEISISCFTSDGEIACPGMTWSATIGIIRGSSSSAGYTSSSLPGSGSISAAGIGSDNVAFSCTASVTVTSTSTVATNCSLSPSSLTIGVNQQQTFTASCTDNTGISVSCPAMSWAATIGSITPNPDPTIASATFSSGSVAGSGAVTALPIDGTVFSCTAPVTVTSGSPQVASIRLVPSSLTIIVGGTQQFIAQAYDSNNSYICNLTNSEVAWSILSSVIVNVGSIDANGLFTALRTGTTTVRGTYNAITPSTIIYADAPVTVTNNTTGQVASITVSPASVSLYTGQSQQFTAMAFDSNGNFLRNLPSNETSWTLDGPMIGILTPSGLFIAVAVGATNITATYNNSITPSTIIQGSAIVSVSSMPPAPNGGGGSGGSGGSGGGAYRTSVLLQVSCAGRSMPVTVTYYDSTASSATVEIFYLAPAGTQKVFSRTITTTTIMQFTPENAGNYELRVSLGTDQTTAQFRVSDCTPQTINTTQNVTVNLAPMRELVLQRRAVYDGGFTKEFRVYRISLGSNVNYETEVDLYYTNSQNNTLSNLTIQDSLPTSIVSRASQVSFQSYPSRVESGAEIVFDWSGKSVDSGKQLVFSYSFGRQLTDQMINGLSAPKAIFRQGAISGTVSGTSGTDSGLFASLFGIFTGGISFVNILFILFALVLLFLIYTFVFGKKSE